MGQLVLTISSSVCIKYIATSKMMGPTSMSIRLIECREYEYLKSASNPDGFAQILQVTTS